MLGGINRDSFQKTVRLITKSIFESTDSTNIYIYHKISYRCHSFVGIILPVWNSACVPVAQWLEHCVSSANVVGSIPREHTYWQKMYNLNAL